MEQIKQEIINNIYENGENLITGPILQTVLLDMVDDFNSKVGGATASAHTHENKDILDGITGARTASWDSASEWVENNAPNLVTKPELEGYATEQWVEDQGYLKEVPEGYATEQWVQDQGYLKEVPEGYATTESLNDLSESISQSIADIPAPDLSNYATKPELNEATESVKEWVEAKHYLTSASLSGSVTEETVGFMINDATASVKNWVENQNYATETFVSQAIAEIPGTDLTGYATEQWVEDQGYLKEHQDISGLATTESVTSLSESVAQDFANLNIPDVSGLATTESVNQLSESVAQTIEDLPQPDLSGYLQTSSYLVDSASFDQRINEITGSDLSGYLQTSSYLVDSASFDSRINNALQTAGQAIEGLSTDLNSLSSSVAEDFDNLNIPDVSGYATTESVNNISASFAETIDNIPGTDLTGYATEQWVENQGYLTEHQDISGLATTSSVTALSSSVSSDIQSARTEASQAISGLGTIVEGMSDQISGLSASFDERINSITGSSSPVDLSGYATTSSVNQLSESLDSTDQYIQQEIQGLQEYMDSANPEGIYQNLDGLMDYVREGSSEDPYEWNGTWKSNLPKYATTESVNNLSASFDQRINSITGSGVDIDLRNFLFGVETQTLTGITGSVTNIYSNVSSDTTLGFNAVPDNGKSLGITIHNIGTDDVAVTLPDSIVVNGTTYNLINNGIDNSGSMSIPASEYGDIVITRNGTDLFVRTSIDVSNISGSSTPVDLSGYATTSSVNQLSESVASDIESINNGLDGLNIGLEEVSNSLANYLTTESAELLSASFDQRINDIPGSDVDLSGYATTESVNNLSSSVGDISASFAETIDNITGSGASGNYLPLTGGTLTGTLKVNASVGIGTDPQGNKSLAVGNSTTNTKGANYSLAVGESCKVGVYGGVALGRETAVEGNGAFGVATGFRNRVSAMAGYAGGCRSTASANFAFAAGFGAEAASLGQVVLGSYNVVDRSSGTGSYAVILANGKSSTWNQDNPGDITRSNGLAIRWDGGIDIDYSGSTITLQDKLAELEAAGGIDPSSYATTESVNNLSASFDQRINSIPGSDIDLSGYVTTESLNEALSEVGVWVRGKGSSSAVLSGSESSALGQFAVAEGRTTGASGSYSHAEGWSTRASGSYSHAEGTRAAARGDSSHAEGIETVAMGAYSHAEGWDTWAGGQGSHAEGQGTEARNSYSHAEGYGSTATNVAEHAQGRFNATHSNQIFSVGVGSSEDTRKNAISIITGSNPSASVFIYGIGGYDGTNPESGTNDLATVLNSITSSGGSPVDLSGYATTESVNTAIGAVNTAVGQVDYRVTNLSASFDQRIDEIVAASGGVDPSNFAKAPSVIYQTDGSTGLAGVNTMSSGDYVFSDEAWQLENLDLSTFDRIDCYFKHSSPRIVTVVLDDVTLDSTFGAYVEKASAVVTNIIPNPAQPAQRTDFTRKWVAVDSTKTKLQVAVNSDTSDLLYKIVGYPKIQ